MTDLIPAPRARPQPNTDLAKTVETLATVVTLVLTVGILFVAREILVPIVIAILLSFVMSPLVKLLRNIGVGKSLSVGLVVLASFLLTIGSGAILAKQISDLVADAPRYQQTATNKIDAARDFMSNNPVLRKINTAVSDVTHMSPEQPGGTKPQATSPAAAPSRPLNGDNQPVRVSVVEQAPGLIDILQRIAGTAASPVATAAFVAIFIVFILMQREDLRNRFIRLVGSSDLQRTTLAMNDAARRLSRYFLAQMLLNTAFGVVVAIGLTMIGVPSAILWGIFAILMRFIPYVGAIGAAFFPVLLAAAANPGWGMAVETAAFFLIFELIVGQVIEPLLYGHNTGISPIAVVISATFWTWLWGPVGLVLSTPLTVCLVVIGRHVERLSFFDVILGDAPALTPAESFYQRVLAADVSEVADHAERYLKDNNLLTYCDDVAMPALLLAQGDVRRGRLDEDRLDTIHATVSELMEDLFDRDVNAATLGQHAFPTAEPIAAPVGEASPTHPALETATPPPVDAAWRRDAAILCVSGRSPLDLAAAEMLADLLRRRGFGAKVEPMTHLIEGPMGGADTKLIVLSFLDADVSLAQARFAVRRLRRRLPDTPVAVGAWNQAADAPILASLRDDIRCDACVATLAEAVEVCLSQASRKDVELAA